jgi:signal transduction histidine kinase
MRAAVSAAVLRAAHTLAEADGKTAAQIAEQLGAIVELIPALIARPADQPSGDGQFNLPRRYVDVFRSELVAQLVELSLVGAHSAGPSGHDVVMIFAGLEEFSRRIERKKTEGFVGRLSGAESVNAVVEIVHDIRSPLSSILFLAEMIRRGKSGPVSPLQERQLALVYSAALGLSNLSSDLIDAIRGERLVDGRHVPFSITEIILGVCAIVEPIGEEKGLPLHVTVPEVDGRLGYPSAIGRVLLNLTTNALRYTERGSVSIGCTERPGHLVEFWVKDTGRGIPDNVLAMLFDGFRPTSVGMRFSSAGLGLAICRTLLEAMDSSLAVDTSPERGTRFSFVLKLPAA